MRVGLILWDGNVGGAEKLTAELAGGLRAVGVDARVPFVRDPGALAADLDRLGVPYESFGARRVEEVLWRPRAFARFAASFGPDGSLLPTIGHLAPALRVGGYSAPLVAVEHGFLLLMKSMGLHWRLARHLERLLSAPFIDAEVAVSDFMRDEVMRVPHVRTVRVIRNGIDLTRFTPQPPPDAPDCVFGAASRMVDGKGIPELVTAFARVSQDGPPVRLRLAGDGPERARIVDLVSALGVDERVELAGVVGDMAAFWRDVDVAVMPSTGEESFGMVALEAMACGRPVVATTNGGVEQVMSDGVNGMLVARGDADALASAMQAYARDPGLRGAHGQAGRQRAEAEFTMQRCASEYAALLREIGRPGGRPRLLPGLRRA
jgi:glycosyltransferase involved in cell wall biosynthesis